MYLTQQKKAKEMFWHYKFRKTSDYTKKKIVIERKPIDRLDHKTGTYMKKNTLNYCHSSKRRRYTTFKVPTIELQDQPKSRNVTKDRTNI